MLIGLLDVQQDDNIRLCVEQSLVIQQESLESNKEWRRKEPEARYSVRDMIGGIENRNVLSEGRATSPPLHETESSIG